MLILRFTSGEFRYIVWLFNAELMWTVLGPEALRPEFPVNKIGVVKVNVRIDVHHKVVAERVTLKIVVSLEIKHERILSHRVIRFGIQMEGFFWRGLGQAEFVLCEVLFETHIQKGFLRLRVVFISGHYGRISFITLVLISCQKPSLDPPIHLILNKVLVILVETYSY